MTSIHSIILHDIIFMWADVAVVVIIIKYNNILLCSTVILSEPVRLQSLARSFKLISVCVISHTIQFYGATKKMNKCMFCLETEQKSTGGFLW